MTQCTKPRSSDTEAVAVVPLTSSSIFEATKGECVALLLWTHHKGGIVDVSLCPFKVFHVYPHLIALP